MKAHTVCSGDDLNLGWGLGNLPPKCSFIHVKTSLRGSSSVRWHQQPINEGASEEEALGSRYTASNVADQTVWAAELWGTELRWDHHD